MITSRRVEPGLDLAHIGRTYWHASSSTLPNLLPLSQVKSNASRTVRPSREQYCHNAFVSRACRPRKQQCHVAAPQEIQKATSHQLLRLDFRCGGGCARGVFHDSNIADAKQDVVVQLFLTHPNVADRRFQRAEETGMLYLQWPPCTTQPPQPGEVSLVIPTIYLAQTLLFNDSDASFGGHISEVLVEQTLQVRCAHARPSCSGGKPTSYKFIQVHNNAIRQPGERKRMCSRYPERMPEAA